MDLLVKHFIGYADEAIEATLLLYLAAAAIRGRWRGLAPIGAYMLVSVGVGIARELTFLHYGPLSRKYAICYWLTDFLIVLSVFLLICYFFRRASLGGAPHLWPHIRLLLLTVFVLTGAASYFIVASHHATFFPYFVLEFQQDLYFVCLVLTTMLYLLVVQFDSGDEQLGLLVAGLGIEYAGFAASLALFHVTGGGSLYQTAAGYLFPLCDIGMTLVWLYTAIRVPYRVAAREVRRAPEALPVGQLVRIS
jgi:hypothetical protein